MQAEVLTLRASLSVSDKKTNEKKRDLLLSPSLALSPTTNQMSKKPNPLLSSRLSSTLNSSIGSTGSSATLCNDETPEEDDVILYEDMDDDNNNEDSEIIEEDYVEHSHFNQVEENENN